MGDIDSPKNRRASFPADPNYLATLQLSISIERSEVINSNDIFVNDVQPYNLHQTYPC